MDASYYDDLTSACDSAWQTLANSVWNDIPTFIAQMFSQFVQNPLCLAISAILLTVCGFLLSCTFISSFNERG